MRIHAAITFALLVLFASSASALEIVSGGQSAFTIVVPDEPTPTAQMAARELQSYLNRITGAELPLVAEADAPVGPCVYIGPCRAVIAAGLEAEEREAYAIRHLGDDLLITYAVCARD